MGHNITYHDDASITYFSEAQQVRLRHTCDVENWDYTAMSPSVRRHVTEHIDTPTPGYPLYMPRMGAPTRDVSVRDYLIQEGRW